MSDAAPNRHLTSRVHEARLALRAIRAARCHLERAKRWPEELSTDVLRRRLAEEARALHVEALRLGAKEGA